jgi:hypothetical protein
MKDGALLPSRAPTERRVVLDTITCRGRRSGGAEPSSLPLALQPVREEPPDEFVQAHPLEVGASTEPTKQRGVEADLDHGHGHVLIVTAEPDRSADARRSVLPGTPRPRAGCHPFMPMLRLDLAWSGRRTYPVRGNFARTRKFWPARASSPSEVREWRWSAWRRRHTAPGPSLHLRPRVASTRRVNVRGESRPTRVSRDVR